MADQNALLDALVAGLAAACPGRVVSRKFKPLAQVSQAALLSGVVSVITTGEKDFPNYRGREAQLGTLEVFVIGQLEVADKADPEAVERAELALTNEVKNFLAGALPAPVEMAYLRRTKQSGQLEYPYGWVVFDLEVA